ncbi:galactoside alpha-(1,2)-fucosyltransferase 2-like [Chelonoidis abingdonii]|uniref:galactoside alpha-(1,2)-fucosyltransferase 2-like n=1 Tax=Chelonoidis abingdonii TaxID=106734 RepID=UPI003F4981D0
MTAPGSWVPFRLPLQLSLYLLAIMTFSFLIHLHSWFPTARERLPSPNATDKFPTTPPTTPTTEQGMWTMNSAGRLGNQMGEYATLYALAKMNRRQAYILPEMHQQLAPLFRITLPVLSSDMVQNIPWKDYGLHDWMSEEYRHIEGKYVRLTGYPCSWTFYHHLRQEILQEFSFHDHIKEEANRYLAGLRGQRRNVTYVGVHVRRGDYRSSPDTVLLELKEREQLEALQEGTSAAVAESCGETGSLLKFAVEEQVSAGARATTMVESSAEGERRQPHHQKPKKGKKHSNPGKASSLGGNLGRQLPL